MRWEMNVDTLSVRPSVKRELASSVGITKRNCHPKGRDFAAGFVDDMTSRRSAATTPAAKRTSLTREAKLASGGAAAAALMPPSRLARAEIQHFARDFDLI